MTTRKSSPETAKKIEAASQRITGAVQQKVASRFSITSIPSPLPIKITSPVKQASPVKLANVSTSRAAQRLANKIKLLEAYKIILSKLKLSIKNVNRAAEIQKALSAAAVQSGFTTSYISGTLTKAIRKELAPSDGASSPRRWHEVSPQFAAAFFQTVNRDLQSFKREYKTMTRSSSKRSK